MTRKLKKGETALEAFVYLAILFGIGFIIVGIQTIWADYLINAIAGKDYNAWMLFAAFSLVNITLGIFTKGLAGLSWVCLVFAQLYVWFF